MRKAASGSPRSITSIHGSPVPNWFWLISLAAYGGCIGSFLNVVIYRLPEGLGIVTPRSRCPKCEHALAWYDNVPVLGWLWLRGKCRYCKEPISVQYPLVEAGVALMFAGLYAVYYMTPLRPEFYTPGFAGTWPVLIVHLILLSGLFAATVIDAKFFIIPRSIPWVVTLVAAVALPLALWMQWVLLSKDYGLFPLARPTGVTMAAGGLIGLGLAILLLKLKVLPLSFPDFEELYEAHIKEHEGKEDPPYFHYPHTRREIFKELPFIALPGLGMLAGWWLAPANNTALWQPWVFVLGGVGLGYLFGAGLVWVTRIFGTLLFGREAMGQGDIHLLAAIGVVLGPGETIPVFFIAPFFGLTAYLVTHGLGAMFKKRFQEIPYGPYLAGAAVVVMIWREPIIDFIRPLLQIFDILFVV
jgi:leader peptidase (prepilin peptidase) / N-methyltransferase